MSILHKLFTWFDDFNIDFRLERYLAGSADIYDLERRQQKWVYMTESERNHW